MKQRKIVSGIVAFLILCTVLIPVQVLAYTDVTGHWAGEAILRWTEANVIQGEDNSFRPDDNITRAETAAVLDRVIGYQETADNTFRDVQAGSWYEASVLKLNAAGVMNGDGDGSLRPGTPISREETVVMFARAFGLKTAQGTITQYGDAGQVSDWAVSAVAQMTAYGYIQGDNGNFRPQDAITRAEVITILDQMVGLYAQDPGEYQGTYGRKMAVVKSDGTVLSNSIFGGAVISPQVGTGTVTIKNTQINGTLVNLAPDAKVEKIGATIESTTETGKGETVPPNFIGGGTGGTGGGTAQTYTVTYHSNGGVWGSATEKRIEYRRNAKLSSKEPAKPTRNDYIFDGWYRTKAAADGLDDSQSVNMSQVVTKNMPVYAGWQEEPSVTPSPTPERIEITVRFLSSATEIAFTQKITQGQTVEAPDAPTRNGFDFAGWYYGVTAESKKYQAKDTFEANTDVYAVWTVQEAFQDQIADVSAVEEEENSKTEVYPPQVLAGEPVLIKTVTEKGYTTEKPVITYQKNIDGTMTTVTVPESDITMAADGSYTYVVPDEAGITNVEVTPVVVKATYAVTVRKTEHGTVAADRQTAQYQDLITLTVTPETGYELKALKVMSGGSEIDTTKLEPGQYTFAMPDADVTVSAEFEEITGPVPSASPSPVPTLAPTATPTEEPTATPAPLDSSASLAISSSNQLYGKTSAELMDQVAIEQSGEENKYAVSGRLHYVSGYTEWSSVEADQRGHYLAIDLTLPEEAEHPDQAVVTFQGAGDAKTYQEFTASDPVLTTVWRISDLATQLSYTVDLDGDGTAYLPVTYTVALSGLTLQKPDWADSGNHLAVVPVHEVYEVRRAGELAWIAAQVNTGALGAIQVKLMNDIDLKNFEWTPIGTSEHPFSGVFEGNSKEIKNLKIEKALSAEAGDSPAWFALFGVVKGTNEKKAELNNLTVTGSVQNQTRFDSIENPDDIGRYTALVVAETAYTDIHHITANGSVSSGCKTVGGIAAKVVVPVEENTTVSIRDCVNNAAVNGTYQTAGVVAYTRAATEKGTAEISRCANNGTVTSDINVGGIAGLTGRTNILQSKNTGAVVTTDSVKSGNAGGIVGIFNGGNIGFMVQNCYNTAAVTSAAGAAAGIMGMDSTGLAAVEYCYNTGVISAANTVDGRSTSAGIYGGTSGTFSTNFVNTYYLDGTAEYGACFGYQPNSDTSGAKISGKADIQDQFEEVSATQLQEAGSLLNHGDTTTAAAWRIAPSGENHGYPVLNWEYQDATIPSAAVAVTDDAGLKEALTNESVGKIVVQNNITLSDGTYGPADDAARKSVVLRGGLVLPANSSITIQNLDFTTQGKTIVTNMIYSDAKQTKTFTLRNNTVTGAFACVLPDILSGTVTVTDNVFTNTYAENGGFTGDISNNTCLTTRDHDGTFVVTGNTFQRYGAAVTYAVDPSKLTFEKNLFLDNNTDIIPMGSGVINARYNYFQGGEPKILTGWSVCEPYYINPECTELSPSAGRDEAFMVTNVGGDNGLRIAALSTSSKVYLPEGSVSSEVEVIPFDIRDTVLIGGAEKTKITVTESGSLTIKVGETEYTVPVVQTESVEADVYLATSLEGLTAPEAKLEMPLTSGSGTAYLNYETSIPIPSGQSSDFLYLKVDSPAGLTADTVSMSNEMGTFSFECENNVAKIPYELANAPFGRYDSINFSLNGTGKSGNYSMQFTGTATDVTPVTYDFSEYVGTYEPQTPLENGSGIEIIDESGTFKGGLTGECLNAGGRPDLGSLSNMSSAYDKDGILKYQQFSIGYTANCYLRPGAEDGTLVAVENVRFRKVAGEKNAEFSGFIPAGTVFVKQ